MVNNLILLFLLDKPQEFFCFVQMMRRENVKMQYEKKDNTRSKYEVKRNQKMLRWDGWWISGRRLREENKRWSFEEKRLEFYK